MALNINRYGTWELILRQIFLTSRVLVKTAKLLWKINGIVKLNQFNAMCISCDGFVDSNGCFFSGCFSNAGIEFLSYAIS